MITLSKRLKEAREKKEDVTSDGKHNKGTTCVSIRDKLLTQEFADVGNESSSLWHLHFPDPDILHQFQVIVQPDEGLWKGGKFTFNIIVPDSYNIKPPSVKCATKLWHPNISLDGGVCLSVLRDHSLDGTGWAPTRSIKDVIWGLCLLFTDLLDFDDPLNAEAADEYRRDRKKFERSVWSYLRAAKR